MSCKITPKLARESITKNIQQLALNSGAFESIPETVKEGVDFVFEQSPELSSIGTKEQYSQYLDQIFPNSVVKDIVYHGSPVKFDNFKKEFADVAMKIQGSGWVYLSKLGEIKVIKNHEIKKDILLLIII